MSSSRKKDNIYIGFEHTFASKNGVLKLSNFQKQEGNNSYKQ